MVLEANAEIQIFFSAILKARAKIQIFCSVVSEARARTQVAQNDSEGSSGKPFAMFFNFLSLQSGSCGKPDSSISFFFLLMPSEH